MTARGWVAVTRRGRPIPTALPVVMLHGGGPGCHAKADFAAVLPHLAERDMLLVDLPGYGASPLQGPAGPRFTGGADTVAALLNALRIRRCDLVAQSLGGIVGLVLAAHQPGRIRRLIVIGSQPVPPPPGIQIDPSLGPRVRAAYYGDGQPSPQRLKETVMTLEWCDPERIPDELVAARYAASVTHDGLAVAADPALLGDPEDLSGLLAAADAETLVLWGEHDPFGEPAYGEWLASQLPHGDAALMSGAAHHPQSEFPQATAELINTHLT